MTREKNTLKILIAILIFAIMVICTFFIGPLIIVKTEKGWVCSNTGSKKHYTEWIFEIETKQEIEISPLEQWMRKKSIKIKHNWIQVTGTGQSFLFTKSYQHGTPPPIYYFPKDLLQKYIDTATEENIINFIQIIQKKSSKEQEKAIDIILTRIGYK